MIARKIVIFSVTMILCTCKTSAADLQPIILIPGSGGNQIEARLTENYNPSSPWCNRWYPLKKDSDGWFRLWFDPSVLLRPFTKCFNERMMVYYDPEEDDYHNAPGVETRVPHFGSTEGLLYLDPYLKKITSYMQPLVKSLEQIGYVSGQNLFGAPFDFRYGLAAKGHPCKVGSKYLADLKTLIESATASNENRPAILITHSLGALFALQLLNSSSIPWRQKHTKHLITLSAPWGGTVEAMRTFASGNAFGVPFVDPLLVREEQRSSPSNLWLLPNPGIFKRDKPIVVTSNGSYSSWDIPRFLGDIGFPEGVYPYEKRVLPLVESLPEPGVGVTCLVGSGVETADKLVYGDCGFDKRPEVVFGDGDGTVNMISLLALENAWDGRNYQSVKVVKIRGVSHTAILTNEIALREVIEDVSSLNSGISRSNRLHSF